MGPVFQDLQVQQWQVQFYLEEADPSPPFAKDKPRVDILITFTDGTWLRWHCSGKHLIWSTTPQPTSAMIIRMNRKNRLLRDLRDAH